MEPQWAIIFRIWPDLPVFHRLGGPNRTLCGRKIGVFTPLLPMKHAKRFGRACRGCFPDSQEESDA